jgi:predicted nuclease with TOPRIM domain
VRALSGQRGLYVQLLALARQQSGFVATGETEALMAVLAARSRLIDQVAPLDQELQPFKGRWQEVLDGLGADDRGVVAGLLKEVQQLLADILAQDELDKESLERQKADVGGQIKVTVTGAALARAYGRK